MSSSWTNRSSPQKCQKQNTDKNKLETNTKTNEQSYVRGVGHGRQKHHKREQRQSSHSRVVSHSDEGTKQEKTSVNSKSKLSHELGATLLHDEHYINTTNGCRHPLSASKSRPPRSLLRIQGNAMTLQQANTTSCTLQDRRTQNIDTTKRTTATNHTHKTTSPSPRPGNPVRHLSVLALLLLLYERNGGTYMLTYDTCTHDSSCCSVRTKCATPGRG